MLLSCKFHSALSLRKIHRCLISIVLLTIFVTTFGTAKAGWGEPTLISPNNEQTTMVLLGDMNGDGSLDLLTRNNVSLVGQPDPEDILFLNDGTGSLKQTMQIHDNVISLADLNGDGTLDIVASPPMDYSNPTSPTKDLVIYYNNGRSELLSSKSIANSSDHFAIATGDVNNDGTIDIIIPQSDNQVSIHANDGRGNFSKSIGTITEFTPHAVVLGDIDGKNGLDIIAKEFERFLDSIPIALPNGNTFYYSAPIYHVNAYLNNGVGQFSGPMKIHISNSAPIDLALGDLNGDGALDLVEGNSDAGDNVYDHYSKVFLNLNDGSGLFQPGLNLYKLSNATDLELGDVDNNGTLDIIIARSNLPTRIFLNMGKGHMDGGTDAIGNFGTNDIVLGDLNNDGFLDIVLGNGVTNLVGNELVEQPNVVYFNDRIGGFRRTQLIQHDFCVPTPTGINCTVSHTTLNVALGDVDNDNSVDIIEGNPVQPITVHKNDGNGNFKTFQELIRPFKHTDLPSELRGDVILADLNNDHALDLLETTYVAPNVSDIPPLGRLVYYENQPSNVGTFSNGVIISDTEHLTSTTSIAVGDFNQDGNLDIVVGGMEQPTVVYLNNGNAEFTRSTMIYELTHVKEFALGDMDNDGGIDIVVVTENQPVSIYFNSNDGTGKFPRATKLAGPVDILSVVLADLSNDGFLDIVTSSLDQPLLVQYNNGQAHFDRFTYITSSGSSQDITIGDVNNDGHPDIVLSDFEEAFRIYHNNGTGGFSGGPVMEPDNRVVYAIGVEVGDINRDGRLDIVTGHNASKSNNLQFPNISIFLNMQQASNLLPQQLAENRLPDNSFQVNIKYPILTGEANYYSSHEVVYDTKIPIEYTLFDDKSNTLGRVELQYSVNRGGTWNHAANIDDPTQLTSKPYPQADASNMHSVEWDTFASRFFGRSDDVMLRLIAYQSRNTPAAPGTYRYYNNVAGTFRWPYVATTSFPFRVGATQIKVYENVTADGNEVSGAFIYRLGKGFESGANLMPKPDAPLATNFQGFLPGAGELDIGDRLFAILPVTSTQLVTFTDKFTLYHTSGQPTIDGLQFHEVAVAGLQELTVTAAASLLLLNLDVSLEWDARNDLAYLAQLKRDIVRTSEILYDLSNGQIALGEIRIYQAKEKWVGADIRVYARNDLIPNANMGGIVTSPISDTLKNGKIIPNAMVPGQVRIGATWNRYGEPDGTVGEDWPRVLAHELGHYAFFLLDDYLGVSDDKFLISTDCQGTAMTDAYRIDYSEFLDRITPSGDNYLWKGECDSTIAEHTTGRSDWQTIQKFYPFLKDNHSQTGKGPLSLPLNITTIEYVTPTVANTTLPAPFVYLSSADGSTLALKRGEAQAYLYQLNDQSIDDDDVLIPVGTPNGPLIQARGASPGDRFCVVRPQQNGYQLGCVESLSTFSQTLKLESIAGWQPQIQVSPVSSTTLAITVTQSNVIGKLHLQILPSYRPTDTVHTQTAEMIRIAGTDMFTQQFEFPMTIASGHVRVWEEGATPGREAIVEFFLSLGWNGNNFQAFGGNQIMGWDGNNFQAFGGNNFQAFGGNNFQAFGGNNFQAFGAPTSSGDGQVTIFNLESILEGNVAAILQTANVQSTIPSWLTPVSNIYRYKTQTPPQAKYNIQFQYLERELPEVQEKHLRIYYSPDDGITWLRQEDTRIDAVRNLASTTMQGEGLYALMATIATPPLSSGWEEFSYPDTNVRSVPNALASIKKAYTSVYWRDKDNWDIFDRTVRPDFFGLVNYISPTAPSMDLKLLQMKPLESYWLFVLNDHTIPYIGVPTAQAAEETGIIHMPPATFYGWVEPTKDYSPNEGDQIIAKVDNIICGVGTVIKYDPVLHAGMLDDRDVAAIPANQLFLPLIANTGGASGSLRYAYKMQIRSDTGDGCGVFGREIKFTINGIVIPSNYPWGNSQACYHPLGPVTKKPYECFTFAAPDLVVDHFNVTDTSVQVVIKNIGTAAVPPGTGFWVDAYINPVKPPTAVNETWQVNAIQNGIPLDQAQGLVWNVKELDVPFEPTEVMTFTIGDVNYRADYSNFKGVIGPDDKIYAQVDSANKNTDYGGVLEGHEMLLQPYNNISAYPVEIYLPLVTKQ